MADKRKTSMEKDCSSSHSATRRNFIKNLAFGAGAISLPVVPVLPGCFSIDKKGHLIPADKKLSKQWIKSLTDRGKPEVFSSSRDELKYIGMPIGGICAGQLYISGDGRLWLWDIFQTNYVREGPADGDKWRLDQFSFGGLYQKPRTSRGNNVHDVIQGTGIRITEGNKAQVLSLDDKGFDNVGFRGEYPVAKVDFHKAGAPVHVRLTAFSPFIPLNVKDSAIPATILSYKITNTSKSKVGIDIGSWLENKVCPTLNEFAGKRKTKVIKSSQGTTLFMTAEGTGLEKEKGWGNMALSLIGNPDKSIANAQLEVGNCANSLFSDENILKISSTAFDQQLVGGVKTSFNLGPGETKSVDFLLSWYFPYYNQQDPKGGSMNSIRDFDKLHRYYKLHYTTAKDVADYVVANFNRLVDTTLLWNKTWYDSTLPYWFLDRSFISLDCLASQTSHLFDNGRFWGWEGVDCCPGTCTHVWQYAQGMARVFPSIERDIRSRVDYGVAMNDDGAISMRAENNDIFSGKSSAVDGQLGTIIRVYREHQISADRGFLKGIWPKVKKSMEFIISQDKDKDGLLEGAQKNTLDAAWHGPMGWISGMYLAAVKVCEHMAIEMGDSGFARQCSEIFETGRRYYVDKLFNGEYFIHIPPDYKSINTNDGCHIDQVLGQSMAHQVNLPDVLPQKEVRSALKSLWKYNFATDAGTYAKEHTAIKGERVYAMPGEAGLLMTTWPYGGAEKAVPGMAERPDIKNQWIGPGGYFDECMNGFEYQVASHMVWEGMITEGLSIMKAVHERYPAIKRNPYDEVECGSHYARSMASYGVFLAACGFTYHGPKGILGFNPKFSAGKFKCPFITAEGWGSYSQVIEGKSVNCTIKIEYGELAILKLNLGVDFSEKQTKAYLNGQEIELVIDGKNFLGLNDIILKKGDVMSIFC